MNSNHSSWTGLSNQRSPIAIKWHIDSKAGQYLATYGDDGSVSDAELQTFLSPDENERAAAIDDLTERRHFMARRSFQRLFLSDLLGLDKLPAAIAIIHQIDTRPVCLDAPELHLSFSSSGNTFIACASTHNAVGIDIERKRTIANVSALAKRFFSPQEADALATLPVAEQDLHFLYYWTAKEAALKAIGKGIVFGLNTFTVDRIGDTFIYKIKRFPEDSERWDVQYLEFVPHHLVALVERIL
jgi:phosphopantetheine--protein transferase-like protein